MRFCRLRWVKRGIGVGLFSPRVFDRVRQDHRLGWVAWCVVCSRRCLLVLHHRRHVSESGRWRLLISHLRRRASDRRASAPADPHLRRHASDWRGPAPVGHPSAAPHFWSSSDTAS